MNVYEIVPTPSSVEPAGGICKEVGLDQCYPNPFNASTLIRYTIPESRGVKLVVFDLLGREVATLVDERKAPGRYQVRFDGSALASGVYFYRLQAGGYAQTKRLLLLK